MVAEIEAFKRAYSDRARHLGDPDFYPVPVQELLNQEYLVGRAKEIEMTKITPSAQVTPWKPILEGDQTTHLSLIDSYGNAISTTQTINYLFGSGVMVPETGVVLNDEMDDFSSQPGAPNIYGLVGSEANKIEPQKRPLSSMTPTIVVGKKGKVRLVLGSPGGSKIITSVYFVLSRILREEKPIYEAISGCRFHHQWLPDQLFLESACVPRYEAIRKLYHIKEQPFMGEVQIVGRKGREVFSLTDPRGHGKPLVR